MTCPMICRPGLLFTTCSIDGATTTLWKCSTLICENECASRTGVKPVPPPLFWTARASRQAKGGARRHPRLRRQQEDQRQTAALARRYAGASAGCLGLSRQRAGQRRSQRSTWLQRGHVPRPQTGVGGRRLWRRTCEMDGFHVRLDIGDRAAHQRAEGLCGAAAPLGHRAYLRMAVQVSSVPRCNARLEADCGSSPAARTGRLADVRLGG